MGSEQIFNNLTFKYGCFEKTDSVSRRLCFETLFLDTCNVK